MLDLSSVQHVQIDGPDFAGRKFMVLNNERVDTGAGLLNAPIMPIPTTLLRLFGTPAKFYLNGVSAYDPESGEVISSTPTAIDAYVYPESYTMAEVAEMPEVLSGDIKVYVPGQAFGYSQVALMILQVRETGSTSGRIS
jgi:hypothetical protein